MRYLDEFLELIMDSLIVHDPAESRVGSGKVRVGFGLGGVFQISRLLSRRVVDVRIRIGPRLDRPASVPHDIHPGIVGVTFQVDAKI